MKKEQNFMNDRCKHLVNTETYIAWLKNWLAVSTRNSKLWNDANLTSLQLFQYNV